MGQAPPNRLIETIRIIRSGIAQEEQLLSLRLRNALTCLQSLGILRKKDQEMFLSDDASEDPAWLYSKVVKTSAIIKTLEFLETATSPSAEPIGEMLSQIFNSTWSRSSKRRYGAAALRWARWIKNQEDEKTYSLFK